MSEKERTGLAALLHKIEALDEEELKEIKTAADVGAALYALGKADGRAEAKKELSHQDKPA